MAQKYSSHVEEWQQKDGWTMAERSDKHDKWPYESCSLKLKAKIQKVRPGLKTNTTTWEIWKSCLVSVISIHMKYCFTSTGGLKLPKKN